MTELSDAHSRETTANDAAWRRWNVAPGSGFEVRHPDGEVGLIQIDRKQFLVESPFRFTEAAAIRMLNEHLVRNGKTSQQAHDAVEDARTFTPTQENPTDLASVPRYMRWFEGAYGAHTLAAILHDDLIVDVPNGGPLEDDTLSDRFFREMMRSAGVPWLKRWIMWSAVALRSRWAVGGIRRLSVLVWLILSAAGITSLVWAVGSGTLGWYCPVDTLALLLVALALPFVAAFLWGKQYGAGIVAAIAALWILPAAAVAGVGYLVYLGLERAAHSSDWTSRSPFVVETDPWSPQRRGRCRHPLSDYAGGPVAAGLGD